MCVRHHVARSFKELEKYIIERRDALAPPKAAGGSSSGGRGREVTAEELMGGPASKPKGFA
jgi:hypothetical protein